MGITEDVLNYGRTYDQWGMTLEDDEVIEIQSEIERLRDALVRISDGEASELASDPSQWPSTIAFLALGGEIRDGQRIYNISTKDPK